MAPPRRQLPARGGARAEDCRTRGVLHRAEGDDHLLQHSRLPPRRVREVQAARPRDRDLLLPGFARIADATELFGLGPGHERARTRAALRAQLKNGVASTLTRSPRMYFSRFQAEASGTPRR